MVDILLLLVVVLLSLVYLWINHHYHYWTRRKVQQAPTFPFCGNLLYFLLKRKSMGQIFDEIYRSHPENDAVGVYALLTPQLLLRSPRLFQKVMVSDFSSFHDNEFYVLKSLEPHFAEDPFCLKGEEWKNSRLKLVTMLTGGKVKEISPIMKESLTKLNSYLKDSKVEYFEAKDLSTLFMMDNVSNSVFGISSNCFVDPQAAFRRMADLVMKDSLLSWWKVTVTHLFPRVRDLMGLRFVPKSVNSFVEDMIREVLKDRVKNNTHRNDLFQHFMQKSMECEDALNEMFFYGMTFFIEGFQTSAMTASRALYELVVNPDIQQRLYEELTEAFGDSFDPDFNTINNLTYLTKVIRESQRKYSLMYTITRICTKPTSLEVDGEHVRIEPGTTVILPVYSVHKDPTFYPNPDRFDPDRFNEDNLYPQYTFMPFGEGPRICPGKNFGMFQVKLLVSNLVYHYKLMKCDKTPEKLTLLPGSLMVVPNEQQWFKIQRR